MELEYGNMELSCKSTNRQRLFASTLMSASNFEWRYLYTMRQNAGKKFYTWLHSWNWDLSVMPGENPRVSCLNRYNESLAVNGASGLKIDACACDAIVTDCHLYAESEGSGKKENSGPFNVHNGVSGAAGRRYPTQEYTHTNTRWWNGNDYFMPDPVGYVIFATAHLHLPFLG
jgi:hypothetical protein